MGMNYTGADKHKKYLFEYKQDKLVAGDNVVIVPNEDGKTATISASSSDASGFVHFDTEANWNAQKQLIGKRGHTYVYTDHATIDGVKIPGIKIGDGTSYLIDMVFVDGNSQALADHVNDTSVHVTPEEKAFWNNKERSFISANDPENLVLTKL